VEGYRAWLLGRGYSASVVIPSLVALGHLGRWMEREAVAVDRLTAGAVSAFLAEYRSDRGRLPTASLRTVACFFVLCGCKQLHASPRTIASYREARGRVL
jgi:hypothetical protein